MLWFPVPIDTPSVPYPSPFVLRNWDRIEQLDQTVLGTDQNFKIRFTGPLPINSPGQVCGSADEWSNGVSYEKYLAGGYACNCPEPVYMSFVNSVHNDDGSITVFPITENVEVHLNTGHVNQWTVQQRFGTSNPALVAVDIQGALHQTAPYIQVRDGLGLKRFSIDNNTDELYCGLTVWKPDGFSCARLGYQGEFSLTSQVNGSAMSLTLIPYMFWFTPGFYIHCQTGDFRVHGRTAVGRDVSDHEPHNVLDTEFEIYCLQPAVDLFKITRKRGLFIEPIFTVSNDGSGSLAGQVHIGADTVSNTFVMTIRRSNNEGSLWLERPNFPDGSTFFLSCGETPYLPDFGIRGDGEIMSARTLAATTPGGVIRKLAIYDEHNSLIGYIPIYNTIT